ncbi:hypothetical protein ACLVWU_13495 [Bdellovibrio sp. HCB290]|uniref:hypothetical protein n=1 Tax=Bdellovibrio sp. HCB290 TaxID=3394356 RepID=UPI0039B3AB41
MKKSILLTSIVVLFASANAFAIAPLSCNEIGAIRDVYSRNADVALAEIKQLPQPLVDGELSAEFKELLQVIETNLINRASMDNSHCESGH